MSAVPDHFSPSRPHEMVSPVLMAILEQLHAKILGELISTEAAGVVLCWLRRVILGLSGKMKDGKFLEAVYSRLCDILDEAKQKGQNRMGLRYISLEIQAELRKVFQGSRNMMVNGDGTFTCRIPELRSLTFFLSYRNFFEAHRRRVSGPFRPNR